METVPSASTVQTRIADFEYTTRRPVPELAGSTQDGATVVVVVVGGGGNVSVTWACVPRVGVRGDGVAISGGGGAAVVVVVVVVVVEVAVVVEVVVVVGSATVVVVVVSPVVVGVAPAVETPTRRTPPMIDNATLRPKLDRMEIDATGVRATRREGGLRLTLMLIGIGSVDLEAGVWSAQRGQVRTRAV